MSPLIKRYIISTLETFLVTFTVTFGIMLEQAMTTGIFPTKELIISAGFASLVAGGKAVSKLIRETLAEFKKKMEEEIISKQKN